MGRRPIRRYMEELTRRRSIRLRRIYIPLDVIMDILSRLPILSLLRFRCVCKSWRSLTNEHLFSTLRLNQSLITNNKSIFTDAIILTPQSKQIYYTIFEQEQQGDTTTNAIIPIFKKIDLSFIPQTQRSRLSIVGVCNGILCLVTYTQICNDWKDRDDRFKTFYIMNPITGQHQQLLPNFVIQGGGGDPMFKMRLISGFGFDETNQVFKMVFFVWFDNTSSKLLKFTSDLHILTLGGLGNQANGGNIWRRKVGCVPNTYFHPFRGNPSYRFNVFLNGSFYWISSGYFHHASCWAIFIAKLNLGNEDIGQFCTFVCPRFSAAEEQLIFLKMAYITLGVLENCLCLVDSLDTNLTDIWIRNLTDHEKEAAWRKIFSIQTETAIIAPPIQRLVIPIKYNDEHLLLVLNGRVIVYNRASKAYRVFKIGEELEQGYNFDVFPIVGSLIRVR